METVLDDQIAEIFGAAGDSMESIEKRAVASLPGAKWILWQGDPQTFAFDFISGDSQELLGYSPRDWIEDAAFWAEHIVHPEDRDDAIAYCALATARGVDHIFEYRARAKDGHIVWLKDYVRVVLGGKRVPVHLRGLMVDVTQEKQLQGEADLAPTFFRPTLDQLQFSGA